MNIVLCILRVSELLDAASARPHVTYVLDDHDAMPHMIELVLCMLPMLEDILLLEAVDAMLRVLEPVLGMPVLDFVLSMLRPGWHAPYPVSWTACALDVMHAMFLSSVTSS